MQVDAALAIENCTLGLKLAQEPPFCSISNGIATKGK